MRRWLLFRASVSLHLTLSRIVSHFVVLSVVVIAVLLPRTTHDQPQTAINVTARFDGVALADRVAENHFDHLSALANEAADHHIAQLANPHTANSIRPPVNLTQYVVQSGDMPSGVAAKFNLKPETILWGNPGLSNDAGALQVGQVLNILPVDGVLHRVTEGETLESIQQMHAVSFEDIVTFIGNHFNPSGPYQVAAGESLIIPNAKGGAEWQAPGPRVIAG